MPKIAPIQTVASIVFFALCLYLGLYLAAEQIWLSGSETDFRELESQWDSPFELPKSVTVKKQDAADLPERGPDELDKARERIEEAEDVARQRIEEDTALAKVLRARALRSIARTRRKVAELKESVELWATRIETLAKNDEGMRIAASAYAKDFVDLRDAVDTEGLLQEAEDARHGLNALERPLKTQEEETSHEPPDSGIVDQVKNIHDDVTYFLSQISSAHRRLDAIITNALAYKTDSADEATQADSPSVTLTDAARELEDERAAMRAKELARGKQMYTTIAEAAGVYREKRRPKEFSSLNPKLFAEWCQIQELFSIDPVNEFQYFEMPREASECFARFRGLCNAFTKLDQPKTRLDMAYDFWAEQLCLVTEQRTPDRELPNYYHSTLQFHGSWQWEQVREAPEWFTCTPEAEDEHLVLLWRGLNDFLGNHPEMRPFFSKEPAPDHKPRQLFTGDPDMMAAIVEAAKKASPSRTKRLWTWFLKRAEWYQVPGLFTPNPTQTAASFDVHPDSLVRFALFRSWWHGNELGSDSQMARSFWEEQIYLVYEQNLLKQVRPQLYYGTSSAPLPDQTVTRPHWTSAANVREEPQRQRALRDLNKTSNMAALRTLFWSSFREFKKEYPELVKYIHK